MITWSSRWSPTSWPGCCGGGPRKSYRTKLGRAAGLERSEEMTKMPENRPHFSFLPNALNARRAARPAGIKPAARLDRPTAVARALLDHLFAEWDVLWPGR